MDNLTTSHCVERVHSDVRRRYVRVSRHPGQTACRDHNPQSTLTMDQNPPPKKPWLQTVPGMLTAVSTSVVALGAIIGSLTPVVSMISDFFLPKGCANRAGYPAGRWVVQDLKTTTQAQYSTFIMFTDQQRGTWLASGGTGSFT